MEDWLFRMSEQNWSREASRRTVLKTTAASIAGLSGVGSSLVSLGRGAEGSNPQPVTDPEPAPAPSIYIASDLQEFNWPILLGNERDSMADALTGYVDDATVSREQKRTARESLKDIWSEVEIKSKTKPWHVIQKQREKEGRDKPKTHDSDLRGGQGHKKRQKSQKGGNAKPQIRRDDKTTVYKLKGDKQKAKTVLDDAERTVRQTGNISVATSQDAESLASLSSVIESGATSSGENEEGSENISPQWKGGDGDGNYDGHNYLSRWAGKNMNIDDELSETLSNNAPKPDDWPYDFPPGTIPQKFDGTPTGEDLAQSYAHAWNPLTKIGHADHFLDERMNNAVDHAEESTERYQEVGYAMHFLQDLGNPLHTNMFEEQLRNRWVHFKYERKVADYLEDGHIMTRNIENIEQYNPVPDPLPWEGSKWGEHGHQLATFSANYASDFLTIIIEHEGEDPLANSNALVTDTQKVLEKTTKYSMGLIGEIHPRYE
ncbi:hypothetical protein [Halorhabdus rudnickae]|uniref:hypothetical protein n=1 Tax=Halorhabdus rudnickae TaxID=1775544 RepID=UPI00143833AA|nr:hypothetical protein [Halorhabdus rudnickae]